MGLIAIVAIIAIAAYASKAYALSDDDVYDLPDGDDDSTGEAGMDLVTVKGYGKSVQLRSDAAEALARMTEAARLAGFAEPLLLPVSGYRSSQKQQKLWEAALAKYGSEEVARKWVAPPGKSVHETGRAVDLWLGSDIGSEHVEALRSTDIWKWLRDNAEKYNFYPYSAEPWHWEYGQPHGS